MKAKKDNKKLKKIIVNGLTISRGLTTFTLPVLFNILSAPVFITVIAVIFFTDFVDGLLAKKVWKVSTIFGTVADMGADKLFGMSILGVLSTMYPLMIIPLILELIIGKININLAEIGADVKSSQIGRWKMWFVGISVCVLFLIGMSPELISSLENIKGIDIHNNILSNLGELGDKIETIFNNIIISFKEYSIQFINWIKNNEKIINPIMQSTIIGSEAITATDYAIKYIKHPNKNSKQYKISEIIKNKQYRNYIKKVWLDEDYHKETQNINLFDKITPPELKEDVKIKKLTLDNNKK